MNALTQCRKTRAAINRVKEEFEIRLPEKGAFQIYRFGNLVEDGWCKNPGKEARRIVEKLALRQFGM
ncbi:MAG: hypothetical protein IPL99_12355 [Candidatus Competibacteraceae bacterium]|nr:hypothetical protein [Candidatus Competibacteraceae bacterium]